MDPITIAVIGTLVVIVAVLITGPYISTIEKQIADINSEMLNDEKTLEWAHESIQKSYQHYFPAEIKLTILQTSQHSADHGQILLSISKSLLQGIGSK